jgi:hypothetical protein
MFKAQVPAYRVPFPRLLLIAVLQVGCAPGLHTVRLETADGRTRMTTPRPRPPLALPKAQVRRAASATGSASDRSPQDGS